MRTATYYADTDKFSVVNISDDWCHKQHKRHWPNCGLTLGHAGPVLNHNWVNDSVCFFTWSWPVVRWYASSSSRDSAGIAPDPCRVDPPTSRPAAATEQKVRVRGRGGGRGGSLRLDPPTPISVQRRPALLSPWLSGLGVLKTLPLNSGSLPFTGTPIIGKTRPL